MIICCKCACEMACVKTGVGADYGGGHVYSGDKFHCPGCGAETLQTNNSPHHDPEYKHSSEYLKMRQLTRAEMNAELDDPTRDARLRGKLKEHFSKPDEVI